MICRSLFIGDLGFAPCISTLIACKQAPTLTMPIYLTESPFASVGVDPALPNTQQPVTLLGVATLMRGEDYGDAAFLHEVAQ